MINKNSKSETLIRELIDNDNIRDILSVNYKSLSIDFLRQFRDIIDWYEYSYYVKDQKIKDQFYGKDVEEWEG